MTKGEMPEYTKLHSKLEAVIELSIRSSKSTAKQQEDKGLNNLAYFNLGKAEALEELKFSPLFKVVIEKLKELNT